MRFRRLLFAALVAIAAGRAAADQPTRSWPQEKCYRYARDWSEALSRYGRDGFSPEFLAGNAGFIEAGCRRLHPVCPLTVRDRELADALAIRVVNEGMSTTFLPFGFLRRRAAP
jgi:hypothetical protein